jgi:RNA polymerase sigma factor (sigma-70 family)
MTTSQLSPVVEHLHAVVGLRGSERSDEELLRAFATGGDESAFAAIVRRYGRLVLGICRRALRHEQDAEDAFQATFLVLARNAASIRKGGSLPSWLHGVAFRVTAKAKQGAARRRALLDQAPRGAARLPPDELTWREVESALDEEVRRLPEIYATPFVLCCLQGLGRAEAARQLGVKEGTISSRLAHGRKRLQEALARRGVAGAALLTTLTLTQPGAALSAGLASASSTTAKVFLVEDMVAVTPSARA